MLWLEDSRLQDRHQHHPDRIEELKKGSPDVQAKELLGDPRLELEPRQVFSEAPVKILCKPC